LASKKLLYDVGIKKVYAGDSDDQLVIAFTDILMSSDGKANGKVKGKAVSNTIISTQIFEYLSSYNILTHFISKISDKEMQVKNLDIIPIDIIISNAADKVLCKRFGFEKGAVLNAPVIECYYKNEKLKNPMVNESHISALGLVTQEEIHLFSRIIAKTNAVLKSFFERRNLFLAELHLKIGRYRGNLYIGNEITPDTCKFWGISEDDKDNYIMEKNSQSDVYKQLVEKLLGNA
jgi:phosphoribosylaminoimidazole-succinocarboxamide synthase